jgi:hypothetical protein
MSPGREAHGHPILLGILAVLVLSACGASIEPGANPSGNEPSAAPALQIISPKSGSQVEAPVTVEYAITGLDPGVAVNYRLRVTIDDPPIYTAELPIGATRGSVVIAEDKLTTGRRNLTFSLVAPNGTVVANPAATVKVTGVTISGRRLPTASS